MIFMNVLRTMEYPQPKADKWELLSSVSTNVFTRVEKSSDIWLYDKVTILFAFFKSV